MWISKKEWSALSGENFALKKRIEKLERIDTVLKSVEEEGKTGAYPINMEYFLVDVSHFCNLTRDLNSTIKRNEELEKEIKQYNKLYLDELQKRLELAEMVKELEGK